MAGVLICNMVVPKLPFGFGIKKPLVFLENIRISSHGTPTTSSNFLFLDFALRSVLSRLSALSMFNPHEFCVYPCDEIAFVVYCR